MELIQEYLNQSEMSEITCYDVYGDGAGWHSDYSAYSDYSNYSD